MNAPGSLGIQPTRVRQLVPGRVVENPHVLYWMQSAQRVEDNHALAFAVHQANQLKLSLVVAFCLVPGYPSAQSRHYRFMLEGLDDVHRALRDRGIQFVVRTGHPSQVLGEMVQHAACVVVDRGYVPTVRALYQTLRDIAPCPVIQVETNVVVPVAVASAKQEYAARTFRPQVLRHLEEYMVPVALPDLEHSSSQELGAPDSLPMEALLAECNAPDLDVSIPMQFGGETQARRCLAEFCERDLLLYESQHNEPATGVASGLSAYLHFGQIAPVTVALTARRRAGSSADAFLEQLIVRRELAINYANYSSALGDYDGLPDWCLRTLQEHAADPRPIVYSLEQLELAQTHDPYWNAAQRQMVLTGRMQGYMRMYWGKKILEWSPSPRQAFKRAVYLNDTYQLDGRDPNGYVGVAWCFGLHDQPFRERAIFGKIRYMNAKGLERKFDMQGYVSLVDQLEEDMHGPN